MNLSLIIDAARAVEFAHRSEAVDDHEVTLIGAAFGAFADELERRQLDGYTPPLFDPGAA